MPAVSRHGYIRTAHRTAEVVALVSHLLTCRRIDCVRIRVRSCNHSPNIKRDVISVLLRTHQVVHLHIEVQRGRLRDMPVLARLSDTSALNSISFASRPSSSQLKNVLHGLSQIPHGLRHHSPHAEDVSPALGHLHCCGEILYPRS